VTHDREEIGTARAGAAKSAVNPSLTSKRLLGCVLGHNSASEDYGNISLV
jgi:hypothetical protein